MLIDERKDAEEELQKSRDLLAATGRMARVGGWEVDADTKAVRWTDQISHIHELPLGHIPPLDEAINFFHPEDRPKLSRALERALDHGEPYDMEIRLITANGRQLWTRTICTPVVKEGKTVKLTGTFQDITEEEAAKEKLQGFAQTQSVLLGEVNHRVKNNLSAIISMINLERHRISTVESKETVQVLEALATRIRGLAIIHSMLSIGGWHPLNLSDLCRKIIQGVMKGAPLNKEVDLHVTPSPIEVNSDQSHHLTLVINELATNSIKYGLKGEDRISMGVSFERDEGRVSLSFFDNGPGYPEEMITGNSCRDKMGLELVRGIVSHSLRGKMTLVNDPGAKAIIDFDLEEGEFDEEET